MRLHRPRILVVGSFMMDLIASTSRAPQSGETVLGEKFSTAPGGKGANQAVQCARLGAKVTMAGRVGNDEFGRRMVDTARQAGVDVSHVQLDSEEPSGVGHITLEHNQAGTHNRITVLPGANHRMKPEDLQWLHDEIGNFEMLMLQLELPMDVTLAAAACAKEAGVPVMLNPAPAAPLPPELLRCVTYLSPNEHEAALLTGHPISITEGKADPKDIQTVLQRLRSQAAGGCQGCIITLGERGSVLADEEGICMVPCVPAPQVADPTAAGDSFVAAFCTALCAGMDRCQAMLFASYTASLTVSRMGAMPSLPTVQEVQQLLLQRGEKEIDPTCLEPLIH